MNDMRQMTGLGRKIENTSFDVIDQEVGPHDFTPDQWEVARRGHSRYGDFEYKHLMMFQDRAVESGVEAYERHCPIVTDVQMIIAGLNRPRLESYGCETYCYISDEDVIKVAKENNSTRAIESIEKGYKLGKTGWGNHLL